MGPITGPREAVKNCYRASDEGEVSRRSWFPWLAWGLGWAWTFIAGGGGLWLLLTRGPWPPTNGWFAAFSGVAACPLITRSLRKYRSSAAIGWAQFGTAALFFAAGHAALLIWPH